MLVKETSLKSADFYTLLTDELKAELERSPTPVRKLVEDLESIFKKADSKFIQINNLLKAITRAHTQFVSSVDTRLLFDELLKNLLFLTQSEYGFIGEVFYEPDGAPYLKSHAITDISWNEETRALYERHAATGLEFRNLNSLFGAVITTGKEVISNSPSTDPRRCGIPKGHPPLNAFLGLPFYQGGKLLGMVGIANRPGGYGHELIDYLQPFLSTCANIMQAHGIDKRKREAEEALKSSEASLANAQRIAHLGNWDWDIIKNDLRWSDQVYRIFEATREEFKSTYQNFLAFVHPDDRDFVTRSVDDALNKKTKYSIDHRIVLRDGRIKIVHEQAEVIFSPEGVPVSMSGTVQDITEQKKTEEDLRESESKYRTLFEDSRDMICIITPEAFITDINPTGVELLGFSSKDELIGRNAVDFYVNPEEHEKLKDLVVRHEFARDYEICLKKKDGSRLFMNITASAVRDKDGKIVKFHGIMRDMTEHKMMQEQLLHAHKMEALGQLTGGIAHDFNNLLTAVIGNANVLSLKLPRTDPNQKYVDNILDTTEKASNLITGLLSFSRKQMITLAPLKLNQLVRELYNLLVKLVREDITFKLSLCDDDMMIMADRGQIEQILINLVTNARDAMPKGGMLTISTCMARFDDDFAIKSSGYGEAGEFACLSVADSGTGMDEETKKRIFEPFFTTKEPGKGTGLGLSIVHGIIEKHNGHINIYSEPGFGTNIKIFMPLTKQGASEEKPRIQDDYARGTETILVAEDNPDVNIITKTLLEEFGYTVILASNGEEAIRKFREHKEKIGLVILDIIMPVKNGKEAYNEIIKISPGVKVLFTSGYTEDILNEKIIFEEGLHFLPKPLGARLLLKKIRDVLDSPLMPC